MPPPTDSPSLFLSYARGDDEPFVKRLYERLTTEGFDVWWDRQRMPSRSLSFLKEIREAVRAADRLVVVIGPQCVRSDYCRAEWQAALAEAKVVNPLVRLGDFALLPPELGGLHCPDFTEDAGFEDSLGELLRLLREPLPIPGQLHGGVPDVPPRYQPRPDATSAVAEAVLIDETAPVVLTGAQRVSVLHGMGGTGKSVLAAAFARATTTRRSFGDGIYWLDVGQQAIPLGVASQLGRLVGTPPEGHGELASCLTDLTSELEGQSALIVADNLWQVEVLEPLIDVLGPSCRLLVTTRIGELATASGAQAVEVLQLTPAAALQQLADWAGVAPEELPDEAAQVAAECGQLPFALALNGAMHEQGVSWAELLAALRDADIDYAEQRFKGYEHPTVLASIKVSMDALKGDGPGYAERFSELAAFLGEGGIPEAAIAVLWAHTGDLKSRDVRKLLGKLAGRALLRREGDDGERRVLIHDLQRDYLVRVTDADTLNAALLAAYRATLDEPDEWVGLPEGDPYIWDHLVGHLIAAGEIDQARGAVCDLAFLARRIEETGAFGAEADLDAVAKVLPDDALVRQLVSRLRHWASLIERDGAVGLISNLHARLWIPGAEDSGLHRLAGASWLRHRWGLAEQPEGLQRVLGNLSLVQAVAFSPDGTCLASGSGGHGLQIWDASSGAELARLSGPKNPVYAVAFSPNGARLASGGLDCVRIWDATSGAELACLGGPQDAVNAVAFSPDGARLASGAHDGSVRIWDAASGAELARNGHEGPVNAVAFSPDGMRLASGADDGSVRIWDAASGTQLERFRDEGRVLAVAFRSDGLRLASRAGDCLRICDAASGTQLARLGGAEGWVNGVVFSADGAQLASGWWDGSVRIWDATSGAELACLGGDSFVWSVAFSPGGAHLASGAIDGLRIWDVIVGQGQTWLPHEHWVSAVAFSPDRTRVASGSAGDGLRVWDAASGVELARPRGEDDVYAVAFSPDGARLASGGGEGTRIWDATRGAQLVRLGGDSTVFTVAFSPDGARLASGTHDGSVRIWDVSSGAEMAHGVGHEDLVYALAFSPDGTRLASGSWDGSVRIWDAASGAEMARNGHEGPVNALAFSPDGMRLASGSHDGSVRIWDAASGTQLARLRDLGRVLAVAFSSDGTRLASGAGDRVQIWDVTTGAELACVALASTVHCVVWEDRDVAVGAGHDVVIFDVMG